MKLSLSTEETRLHARACALARQHRESEQGLCQVLREIGQSKLYLKLGYARLFYYATEELKLSKAVAYTAITVARQTEKFQELKAAVDGGLLSVSKASRIVSSLTVENASEVIAFALAHTSEEIDEEMARRNPEKPKRDHARHVGNDKVELTGQISLATHKLMKRAKSILASKGKPTTLDAVLDVALHVFLDQNDPVRKAERAQNRRAKRAGQQKATTSAEHSHQERPTKTLAARNDRLGSAEYSAKRIVQQKPAVGSEAHSDPDQSINASAQATDEQTCADEFCLNRQSEPAGPASAAGLGSKPLATPIAPRRVRAQSGRPLASARRKQPKAWAKHQVMLRVAGRCTFVNERGERCTEDRWLELHHIVPVSLGGSDDPDNLTCLCSSHHALVHQLSFPIDGQITWLRSPRVAYRVL